MDELTNALHTQLLHAGADLVACGSLAEIPPEAREGLPVGVAVAVKYPKDVIRGIAKLPTRAYFAWYNTLNKRLDALAEQGAALLRGRGYAAAAQTRARVGALAAAVLPHKTVATRAGLGWVGKCALLVTEQFGSMVRLTSVLTDAPLALSPPANESRCGRCLRCIVACPAGAVTGKAWAPGLPREEMFSAELCREAARARARQGLGEDVTLCGKCIEVCPYTRRYLDA